MTPLFRSLAVLVCTVAGMCAVLALFALAQLIPHAVRLQITSVLAVFWIGLFPALFIVYGAIYLVRSRH